jgi:hypothetical protein
MAGTRGGWAIATVALCGSLACGCADDRRPAPAPANAPGLAPGASSSATDGGSAPSATRDGATAPGIPAQAGDGATAPGPLAPAVDRDSSPAADPAPTEIGHGAGAGGPPRSRITLHALDVVGDMPRELVRRLVRRHHPPLRRCYERVLATRPDLAGEATIRFTIDRVGQVGDATASGLDAEVADCLERVFSQIRFPPDSSGLTRVTIEIEFQPLDDGPSR